MDSTLLSALIDESVAEVSAIRGTLRRFSAGSGTAPELRSAREQVASILSFAAATGREDAAGLAKAVDSAITRFMSDQADPTSLVEAIDLLSSLETLLLKASVA